MSHGSTCSISWNAQVLNNSENIWLTDVGSSSEPVPMCDAGSRTGKDPMCDAGALPKPIKNDYWLGLGVGLPKPIRNEYCDGWEMQHDDIVAMCEYWNQRIEFPPRQEE